MFGNSSREKKERVGFHHRKNETVSNQLAVRRLERCSLLLAERLIPMFFDDIIHLRQWRLRAAELRRQQKKLFSVFNRARYRPTTAADHDSLIVLLSVPATILSRIFSGLGVLTLRTAKPHAASFYACRRFRAWRRPQRDAVSDGCQANSVTIHAIPFINNSEYSFPDIWR